MASPSTVGTIGLGSTAAGGVLSAFGNVFSGMSQNKMYKYQAQVARINSQIDLQNADYARNKGEIDSVQYGMKAAQRRGQITAAQGASGLDVHGGSATDVRASQQKVSQMDMNQIRSNAAKTAYDFTVQSVNDLNQAGLYDKAAKNSVTSGILNGLGSIIGTAGSVSSKWLQGRQMGLFGNSSSNSNLGGIDLYGPDQNVVGYVA
jgi:hypothetical protein